MPIRDRLSAAASRAKTAVGTNADNTDQPAARDAAREQLQRLNRQQALAAARRLGEGAQIQTKTGGKLSQEERQSFERAEEATRAGPPVDATLDPVSGPEELESFAAAGRRSDDATADELVYASDERELRRPNLRRGDGFAQRDMMNVQTPLTDPNGSPANEALGVSLVFTDGVPDTAPNTNDIDELVTFDPDDAGDNDSMGWF